MSNDKWVKLLAPVPKYQLSKLRDKLSVISDITKVGDNYLMEWVIDFCERNGTDIHEGANAAWDAAVNHELDRKPRIT